MRLYFLLTLSALTAATGQLLFKLGAQGRSMLLDFINWPLFFGLGLYGISALLWIFVLSRMPLKNAYPFTALTFVLVYLGAVTLFGERPSWRGFTGIGLVLAGLYFTALDR